MDGVKGKSMTLFKTNTTKNYIKSIRVNNVYGHRKKLKKTKTKKQSEEETIRAIEERIIRDIKNLFEQEGKDYYKSG